MPLTGPSNQLLATLVGQDKRVQMLVKVTFALCCAAPLVIVVARGKLPPEALSIFQRLFFFNDFAGSLAMLAALVASLAVPRLQDAIVWLAVWVGEHPLPVIAGTFVALAACSRIFYLAHPFSMDEYAPWMQAHAFARGDLTVQYPPALLDAVIPRAFQGYFFSIDPTTGAVVSKYWPGLAVVMAPFAWLGIPWCANPAFGALTLAVIHRLATDVTGERAAGGWAMLMALASPQFSVGALSFYAMTGELALNLLFVWLLLQPSLRLAFAGGVVGGLALAMHNPAPHVLAAVPCLAWLAADRRRWPRLASVLAGYVPLVLVLGFGWVMLMQSLEGARGATQAMAQAPVPQGAAATVVKSLSSIFMIPSEALLTARWYATWKMWIWACPGLLLLLLVPRERGTAERLLIAGFGLTFVFYLFVRFDQGHGWGYRYIHTAWAVLPIAAGLWIASAGEGGRRWGAAMVAAGLLATPVFLWQTRGTIEDALSSRMTPPAAGEWVIFIAQDTGRYRGDLVQNRPGETRFLYLASQGAEKDATLMKQHFPGAQQVDRERRGSAWRIPDGMLAKQLSAASPQGPADNADGPPDQR